LSSLEIIVGKLSEVISTAAPNTGTKNNAYIYIYVDVLLCKYSCFSL
jgi:hypothetical protein